MIADIGRIDPDDVAETYPDVPLLGFTNHTDTVGLRERATPPGSTAWSSNRPCSSGRGN